MDSIRCNITENQTWIASQMSRFEINQILRFGNYLFYIQDQMLIFLVNFDFIINDEFILFIERMVCKYSAVKFEYLNVNGNAYQSLKLYFEKMDSTYKFTSLDIWDAPGIRISIESTLEEYIKRCDKNLRRNYAKTKKRLSDSKVKLVIANSQNVLECWNDVLTIDYDSWKYDEKSDMKSLNREDLQYIFLLLKNMELCSLVVLYEENKPMSYSLMVRNGVGLKWFAAKWGCNKKGRENYSGIVCLLQHLECLFEMQRRENASNMLDIDFWGRRQRVYDSMANYHTVRTHVVIRRE